MSGLPPELQMRPAEEGDVPFIAEACVAIGNFMKGRWPDPYIDGLPDKASPELEDWSRRFLDGVTRHAWIAIDNDDRVACVLAEIVPSHLPASVSRIVGYIPVCWVEEGWRGKGVGRGLVSQAEDWFRKNGVPYSEVSWLAKNAEGDAAWRGMGYSPFRIFGFKEL